MEQRSKAQAPEPVATLRGHRASVSCVCFLFGSNDTVASGDVDGNILVWSVHSRRILKAHSEAHAGGVLNIAASPNGTQWVSQGRCDGALKIWDNDDLVDVIRLENEGFCKVDVFWNQANSSFIFASSSKNESTLVVKNSEKRSESIFFSPPGDEKWGMMMDCKLIARGGDIFVGAVYEDGLLRVFNISQNEELRELRVRVQSEHNPATTLVFAKLDEADNLRCIAGGTEANLCSVTLNLRTREIIETKFFLGYVLPTVNEDERVKKGVGQIALRSDERILALACWDHRVRIVHFRTLRHLAVLRAHRESVQCVTFSNDATLLASGSKDQNVLIWTIYPPDQ